MGGEDYTYYQELLDALKLRAKLQYDGAVDAARRKYETKIEAIEQVELLLAEGDAVMADAVAAEIRLEAASPSGPLPISRPSITNEAITLIASVERLFRTYPGPWSVQTLEKKLRFDGFTFEAANPKSSINTALTRLSQRQTIYVVEKGSGRRPNQYKLLPFEKSGNGRSSASNENVT